MMILQWALKVPSMLSGDAAVVYFMRQSKLTLKILSMIFFNLFINIHFFLQSVCQKLLDLEFSYIKFA